MKLKVPLLLADAAPIFQVEEEMEGLREIYRMRPEVKEEEKWEKEAVSSSISPTSSVKKEQDVACWQETLQRLLDAQELGNNYVHTVAMVSRRSGTGSHQIRSDDATRQT